MILAEQCKGKDTWFPWFIKAEYVYSVNKSISDDDGMSM